MRFRRKTLPQLLSERILEPAVGDLADLVTDAYLRQDMEWLREALPVDAQPIRQKRPPTGSRSAR